MKLTTNCSLEDLIGCTIISYNLNNNHTILTLYTKEKITFKLIGNSAGHMNSFLEYYPEELDRLLNQKVIDVKECGYDGEYIDGELHFFYEINTFDSDISIRFVGEDDYYYASEIKIERDLFKDEIIDVLEEKGKLIKMVNDEIEELEQRIWELNGE